MENLNLAIIKNNKIVFINKTDFNENEVKIININDLSDYLYKQNKYFIENDTKR